MKRRINNVTYELELPDSLRVHPVFHVTLLKPAVSNPFPDRDVGPPEPVFVDGEEEFEVEAVLDCRRRRNQVQYLIKWRGYGPENNSWEPGGNIHAQRLVQAFKNSHPDKFARLGIRSVHERGTRRALPERFWRQTGYLGWPLPGLKCCPFYSVWRTYLSNLHPDSCSVVPTRLASDTPALCLHRPGLF